MKPVKLLGDNSIMITATTVRVPVYTSHSESINIELKREFDLKDVINLLKNSPGIIVENDVSKNTVSNGNKCSRKEMRSLPVGLDETLVLKRA